MAEHPQKLCVPAKVLDQHLVVLGKTGAGKSSALRHLVEHLLSQNKRVCIVDPKGDWWGLKTSADGKAGGFPVIAFGDFKNAKATDVPLNERSGKHVAELVATGNRPCVVGFRGWMTSHMVSFWIDFASTLFAANVGELYLVVDEFHNFAPKGKILDPQAGKCLHWSNRLLSEGRGLGIVCLTASQRPQKVHNDSLTSHETLVAMRVIHKADRDAIKDWIDGNGDPDVGKEVLNTLASLERGEAWVWSPEIGFRPKRVKFPMFTTFDSFAPPQLQRKVSESGWADVDLNAVKEKLADVIQEEKANDPTELKRQLAALKRELSAKPAAAPAPPPKIKEVPILGEKHVTRLESIGTKLEGEGRKMIETGEKMLAEAAAIRQTIHQATARLAGATAIASPARVSTAPRAVPPRAPAAVRQPSRPVSASAEPGAISRRQQNFLDAAATLTTIGTDVTRETVAAWVGVHPRGGSVGEELKALMEAGMIIVDRGQIRVTTEGMAAAGSIDPSEAITRAKAGLSNRQRGFFEQIEKAYPDWVTREAIAEAFGIHPRGGSLGEDLGRLVGRGLVEKDRGAYRMREFLAA